MSVLLRGFLARGSQNGRLQMHRIVFKTSAVPSEPKTNGGSEDIGTSCHAQMLNLSEEDVGSKFQWY